MRVSRARDHLVLAVFRNSGAFSALARVYVVQCARAARDHRELRLHDARRHAASRRVRSLQFSSVLVWSVHITPIDKTTTILL